MKRVELGSVPPLRKRTADGEPYKRRRDIEALLSELVTSPRDEVAKRAAIRLRDDPSYLPSECLVHLLRTTWKDNSERWFERLYKALVERVLRCLPAANRTGATTQALVDLEVRDKVMGQFLERLSVDRAGYDERLDYFEINFDSALATLRCDARRQAWRGDRRRAPIVYDEDDAEPSAEVEEAARRFIDPLGSHFDESTFRSRLEAAIDALPQEQSRIIHMLMDGFPIDSNDSGAVTIAKAIGRSEKTVRTYRNKAIATLRGVLDDGEDQ